jgi:hypothetical protein
MSNAPSASMFAWRSAASVHVRCCFGQQSLARDLDYFKRSEVRRGWDAPGWMEVSGFSNKVLNRSQERELGAATNGNGRSR